MKTLRVMALVICVSVAGCGDSAKTVETPAAPSAASSGSATQPVDATTILVRIRAVDRAGNPIAGITPIASKQPNAFDPPIEQGEPTPPSGISSVTIPAGQRLFVRAWDPSLKRFANNYLEVHADSGGVTEQTDIVMVDSGALSMTLFGPDQAPVSGKDVTMMMAHPTEGPWWPGKGKTDAAGVVYFDQVPPGTYNVQVNDPSTGFLKNLDGITLLPGQQVNAGDVVLTIP